MRAKERQEDSVTTQDEDTKRNKYLANSYINVFD